MNNSTNITYERVRDNANTIRDCSSKMHGIFDDFNQTMNQIGADDVFQGQASEALKGRFNSLKGKFESYTQKVNEFADMIYSAAASTEHTEKNIAGQADNLAG